MAESLFRVRILISCPEDMQSVAAIVRTVANDLSSLLEGMRGVTLRVLDWRKDVPPGVSADPQARLNEHLDYEIYVGLLGARFGTETPRAGSGTEDEFNIAYERYRSDTTRLRILFYFKRSADIFNTDLDQLRRVRDCRTSLPSKGVLYGDFETAEQFEKLFRAHLEALFSDHWDQARGFWKVESPSPALPAPSTDASDAMSRFTAAVQSEQPTGDEEDVEVEGVLDFGEALEETAEISASALEAISSATNQLTEAMGRHSEAMTALGSSSPAKHRKAAVNAAAEDLNVFAEAIRDPVAAFSAGLPKAVRQALRAVEAEEEIHEVSQQELRNLFTSVDGLLAIIRDNREKVLSFGQELSRIPPLTKALRAARRRAHDGVSELVAGMTEGIQSLTELRSQLERRFRDGELGAE